MEAAVRLGMGRVAGDRLLGTYMPKSFDGTGTVKVQCSEGVFAALKLSLMPSPTDMGVVVDGRRYFTMPSRHPGVDSERYRVIWPELSNGPGSKNRTSSFVLSGKHTNETLWVLAEFLRQQGVDFVALANKHGNAFHSAALHGGQLAYLPGTRVHAVLSSVNLFSEPTPEDC